MITLTPMVSNLATAEYLHTTKQFNIDRTFTLNADACCFGYCEVPLPVFADLNNETDSRVNDFTKFILEVPTGSTVVCTLTDLNTDVDYVISDTTYGLFVDVGDIAARPLVWCFIVNWFKVADLISFGDFKFNITIYDGTSAETFNKDTPCFYLQPYSCENAQGTIRIDTVQDGYVQDGFDYRSLTGLYNLLKPQQLRVYGSIDKRPITVTDYIANASSEDSHVQTGIYHEYDMNLHMISGSTYDNLVKGILLEGLLTINSYNAFDSSPIESLKCTYLEVTKEPKDPKTKQERITVKLQDYKKANRKRY